MTAERKDSMMDNPVYDEASPANVPQPYQLESSISDSTVNNTYVETQINIAPNPVYGMNDSFSKPHHSTIRHVQCPIYGDQLNETADGSDTVYSSPDELPTKSTSDGSDQPGYSYAMVEASANDNNKQKNTSSQSSETLVQEHEYAMIDNSTNMHGVAATYNQLKHEPSETNLSKDQSTDRLAENEDLGYSALT